MKTIKVINLLFYFPLSIWRQLRNSFCKNGHQEPLGPIIETLVVFAVQITFGYLRDFLVYAGVLRNRNGPFERNREGYVPLYNDFENFYRRNIFRPISFVIGQPIASIPGPTVQIVERYSDDYNRSYKVTNSKKTLINMVSYNYLNMNQSDGPVSDSVQRKIITRSVGLGTSRHELGTMDIHLEMESLMAGFLRVEDVLTVAMGFATNTTVIPALLDADSLVLSDELNHTSIVLGCRLARCSICVFKHNDMKDLEEKLREAILKGNPRTYRPFRKILIIVEGVYSMEGTLVNLPQVIRLKDKYKAYLYLDEAHSIGAIGKTGRGMCQHYGFEATDVDLMMGTFTKSFGAAGGYIGGRKQIISYLRCKCPGLLYGSSMSPAITQQIISSLQILMSDEGLKLKQQLEDNTRHFRNGLRERGFLIIGDDGSPVVPLMTFSPIKAVYTVSELKKYGVGAVAVGFPATELTKCRIRFCVSAGHSKQQLDTVIKSMVSVAHNGRIYRMFHLDI